MPVIKITQKDIDRMKLVDEGFHKVKLVDFEEKINKNKNGTNYFFDLQVISEGSNESRILRHMANDKALGIGFIPMVCAFENISTEDIQPDEIDVDSLIGKTCIIEVYQEIYEGREQAKVRNFLPDDASGVDLKQ